MKARCRLSYGGVGNFRLGFKKTLVSEFCENEVRFARLVSAPGVSEVGYPHTGDLLVRAVGVVVWTHGDDCGLEFRCISECLP
jgi:hypothetical protein